MKPRTTALLLLLSLQISLHSQTVNVTTNADSGGGSLRQAITDINAGSDSSNTINLQVPGNSPIVLSSDLPVIKKNSVEIISTGQQPINGQGQYRLFATIMADLSLTNCNLDQGAAIGGNGKVIAGGGVGVGGGVYIDRGNTLTLTNTYIQKCLAQGGKGDKNVSGSGGGGGASFSQNNKNAVFKSGGGDYPGIGNVGGSSDGSPFLTGYGGGKGLRLLPVGNGNGGSFPNGYGGYCAGSGRSGDEFSGGGGGNGGGMGNTKNTGGGGGFGSGGYSNGGGGFGGGGGENGGGGFGGGGGAGSENGRYGGAGIREGGGGAGIREGGGGAGLGGAIFVGDTATCIIQDNVSMSGNQAIGGSGGNPGQGYAPHIFLFREAKVVFDNQQPLAAPYSIMADQLAPAGHLDKGIVKQGPGQLTLSSTDNNYRGGTTIKEGSLAFNSPKALGSSTITLEGGALTPTSSGTVSNPINLQGGAIEIPANVNLTVSGPLSGNALTKTGAGKLTPTNTANNYSGGTKIQAGTLSITDPRLLGSQTAPITLDGGILQPTKTITLPNPIVADSGGTIDTPTGTTLTTTGTISGSGSLNKTSPGTWTQQANSTHTGPLYINQGTLQNQGTLASQITVTPNTQLTNNGTLSGSLTNNGTTTNTSTITGAVTNNGQFNNQGNITGELTNNNQLTSTGTISGNVQNNGTISASGTLGGNVINNGTLKPGADNLGSLMIGGDYTQTSNGLLQLQMRPGNQSDHLNINGTATLDGALELDLEPGIYQKNQKYNLIQANGELDGFFNQISTNSKVQGIFEITPNNFNLIFDNPQIILPVPTDTLPPAQKNLSNYLFCDNFPFEDNNLVNLLQNLFSLTPANYIKALATLTPEHYGALPIGESRCIEYLLTQNPTPCQGECPNTQNSLTLLPLYYRNDVHREHYHLPNYEQNTGGLRLQYSKQHPTNFKTQISVSYLHTHTKWGDHRGTADSSGAYLDTKIVYRKNDFDCSLGVLGAYTYTSTFHNLFIGYPIKAKANPHYWDVAEVLSAQYTARCNYISFIPRVTLVQTNIFLSAISEDKPKGLNLQTESKYFGFLDTLVSVKIQAEREAICTCAKAYVDLGWHGITHLSNRTFHSKLDNYTACQCSFATQTYKGSINRFFMEWGATISYCPFFDLLMNYRTEFTRGDFVQAVNLGASWRF